MYSDASTVTVLDLIKPNISVSTHHPETQISCEAPSPITGAVFHLYDTRSKNIIKESHAGAGERSVTFVVPHDPDPNLRYCCSYQYRTINSVMSDYAGPKEHPVTGISGWLPIVGGVSAACVILLGATALCLCWRHKKHRSNRQPITPSNDPAEASYSVASKEEHNKDPTLSDVTYSSINHMAPQCSYPAPSQDSVVYSSLKTD
ncbi:uncharacterized protein LOC118784194 isoform X2 [Megalops cyprinoides]|uniref:uncharacterized protein LOC118784194 isoform X2 n=1 Tax=Megalops cyprinoides TaxID=118141 RepID=UPI001864D608|nr:uncharacterized protein LOC118784194 isoform X2 [Megalops cyprinoides]